MLSRLLTYLRYPLWIAELATGAKSFADNPLIGSRRLNAMGLHRFRVRAAHAMTRWRRWLLSGGLSFEDRKAFEQQGFVEWRNVLAPDKFQRMREAILGRSWPAREMIQGNTITRHIPVNSAMLRAVPELGELLKNSRWRGLLQYVAASRDTPHYYIQTILTHQAGEESDPQNAIHADTFHSTMKAWLFLTDVTLEDGPLTVVAGGHRLSPERLAWEGEQALLAPDSLDRLSARGSLRIDLDNLANLALPLPTPLVVPANTLVVADTFGFHARGVAARPSMRIELWAYSRGNPFLPWTGFHLGNIKGIADRRVEVFWRLQDRFPKLFGPPMTPVGSKRPDER